MKGHRCKRIVMFIDGHPVCPVCVAAVVRNTFPASAGQPKPNSEARRPATARTLKGTK